MQQKSFYVEHFHQIEGPVKGRALFDQYFRGEVHDDTLVWDTGTRHWCRFVELKVFYTGVRQGRPTFRSPPDHITDAFDLASGPSVKG